MRQVKTVGRGMNKPHQYRIHDKSPYEHHACEDYFGKSLLLCWLFYM
jgi:hypothetical protein